MTLIPVGEPTPARMTFRDDDTGLELELTGGTLTPIGVKGAVTVSHKETRVGRDFLLLATREKRRRLAKEVADATALEVGRVEALLMDLDDEAAKCFAAFGLTEGETEAPLTEEEERTALALLDDPELWTHIDSAIGSLGITGEREGRLLVYLCLTSRLLPKPISAAIKGPSAAGKSYIIQGVLKLFPKSAYYELTSASERALIYTEADFRHRILIILEAHENPFLEMLIRTLLSEGHIIYETVVEMEAKRLEKEGPTGLLTTTTQPTLHEENETRVLSVFIRDDPAQTRAVMGLTADRFSVNGAKPEPNLAPLVDMQRWLEQSGDRGVVVPFAGALTGLLPDKPVRWRRDITQILSAVQACALLHQRQRERDSQGCVIATLEDYDMVRPLLAVALAPALADSLTDAQRKAVESVRTLCYGSEEPVTISAVGRDLNIDRSSASARVRSALEGGYIVNDEPFPNRPAKLRPGKETMPPPIALPTRQEVEESFSVSLGRKRPHGSTPALVAVSEPDSESGVESGVNLAWGGGGVEAGVGSGVESKPLSSQIGGVEAWSPNRPGNDTNTDFDREGAVHYIMGEAERVGFQVDKQFRIGPGRQRYEHRLNGMKDDELKALSEALEERLEQEAPIE